MYNLFESVSVVPAADRWRSNGHASKRVFQSIIKYTCYSKPKHTLLRWCIQTEAYEILRKRCL